MSYSVVLHTPGRHSRQPIRATAQDVMVRSRWSLSFVKKLTMFEVSSTEKIPGGEQIEYLQGLFEIPPPGG